MIRANHDVDIKKTTRRSGNIAVAEVGNLWPAMEHIRVVKLGSLCALLYEHVRTWKYIVKHNFVWRNTWTAPVQICK